METASFISKAPLILPSSFISKAPLIPPARQLWWLSCSCSRWSSSSGRRGWGLVVRAVEANKKKKGGLGLPNSNYVIPLDKSWCITRPLAEILRDLNKKVPENIINPDNNDIYIPWYHANRMLSFYAPGWCGEIRDVIFSNNESVTVVYRVTIRGSDGEAHRESAGTVSFSDGSMNDPVGVAEEIAFSRACARFGLGLYLYHEEDDEIL